MSGTVQMPDDLRERFEEIKIECKDADPGLPGPSDEMLLSSLMDTWEAVGNGYYSSERVEMKFSNYLVERVLNGEKTTTFRLASEWHHLEEGYVIELLDADGNEFGTARIETVEPCTAYVAYRLGKSLDGYADPESFESYLENLQGYYPEKSIKPSTELLFVEFEVLRS